MKNNYIKSISKSFLLCAFLLASVFTFGQDIKYTFANAQNTNDGTNDFFEVDILIESTSDFKLGSGLLYFNYNTAAFGTNVSASNKLEYTQPSDYILGEVYSFPGYKDFVQNDNTSSRVAVSYQQGVSSGTITANNVTSSPKKLFHLKIEYLTVSELPTITFETGASFVGQTFTACGPNTAGFPDCTNFPGSQLVNDTFENGGATLSNEDFVLSLGLTVYPNPTKGLLFIDGDINNIKNVDVFSITGQRVMAFKNNFSALDISPLGSGIYFVKISTNQTSKTLKIIKQ